MVLIMYGLHRSAPYLTEYLFVCLKIQDTFNDRVCLLNENKHLSGTEVLYNLESGFKQI